MCRVNARTKTFAVIGSPIEHSISPEIHNASFESLGINCIYLAHRVAGDKLEEAIRGFKALGYSGINITIPHKIAVIDFLDELSREAELIGAVNTVKFSSEKATGYNTDGVGAIRAIEEAGIETKGIRAVILGYGGAARAIAITLALRGASEIIIAGRNPSKARALAEDVEKAGAEAKGVELSKVESLLRESDILIHATPVGMHPDTEKTLLTAEQLHEELAVMDIVYTPLETRLLREAKKAGCKTIDGLGMLIHQAAEAERIWLGVEADIKAMRQVALKVLHQK